MSRDSGDLKSWLRNASYLGAIQDLADGGDFSQYDVRAGQQKLIQICITNAANIFLLAADSELALNEQVSNHQSELALNEQVSNHQSELALNEQVINHQSELALNEQTAVSVTLNVTCSLFTRGLVWRPRRCIFLVVILHFPSQIYIGKFKVTSND